MDNIRTSITESELLLELTVELTLPCIAPDEVTARMLSESAHMGYNAAKRKLDAKVIAGELVCRSVNYNGKRATAYRKAE